MWKDRSTAMDQRRLRIIVIDDNPSIHQDFKKILMAKKKGGQFEKLNQLIFGNETQAPAPHLTSFHIDNASQGQEGVERIKQALTEGDPYALAFVDVRMPPGWDGIETIKHIWSLDKDIQIVICTAFSDYSWEETVQQLGMSDNLLILKKPFDSIAVRQLASALTKKWQLMQDAKVHMDLLEKTVLERTQSLNKSLSLTRATLESSYNGMIVVENTKKIVDFNHYFIEMWGVPVDLIETNDYAAIETHMLSMQLDTATFLELINYFKTSPRESSVAILKLSDGRFFECYSQPHLLNGELVGRIWSFRDITQRMDLEEKLEQQATHDSLTALPNRTLLIDRIQQVIAQAQRHKGIFSIMFIDLDRFKLINDSFSHEAGDELLVALSNRFRAITRAEDTIARLSGDEFILVSLFQSVEKPENIINIASKLIDEISATINMVAHDITITASIGISVYPQDGTTASDLLRKADLAMYRAKALGGNQFQFYTAELNDQCLIRIEQEVDLRQALINNEFYLDYQPQYDDENKKLTAVEALIRWRHPKYGVLLPMDFIPLAEDTGLIVPIGEWVLRTACAQNKVWQDEGLSPFLMTINVATKQFMQPNLVNVIKAVLNETGLKAEYLEIEVTENVLISNPNVIDAIKKIKKLGVNIVLDDFGTGNSSLNYLRILPIDRLKIDKSFVQNIDSSRSDEMIIQAIIAMARSLNLDVIAEGVETIKQINFLKNQDCKKLQGYYFSKPVSANKLKSLIKQWDKLNKPPNE